MSDRDRVPLPPDEAQRRRIESELGTTMLVEAAAGTGKTTCLVNRMVALLAEGCCVSGKLAAVTFTRKAAAELRARFHVRLEAEAGAASGDRRRSLTKALAQVEQTFIGTIHALCGRLLRERPVEAGVDVGFEELDEDAEYRLRGEAWNEYVARLHAGESGLLGELATLNLEIDRLREAYLAFADYPDVEHWPATPATCDRAALAAARKALVECAGHAESLSLPRHVNSDQLIPFYRELPRRFRNTHGEGELLDLLEDCCRVRVVQKDWPGGQSRGRAERDRWKKLVETHAEPLVAQRLRARYEPALRVLREAAALYKRLRAERGLLSFQDLLLGAAKLLCDKPHVRRYFRSRFSHLLVDEFQDTDPVQAEVMLLLTADDPAETVWRRCRPVPGSLFVVGDPKQSIYRFRRADIVTFNQVREIIGHCGAKIALRANFRSIPPLIDAFNAASSALFGATASDEAPADVRMDAARQGGCSGDLAGVAVLEVPEGREKEAELIARAIRQALDDKLTIPRSEAERGAGRPDHVTPGDFMVVGFVRDSLHSYATRLEAYGVPVEVTGGSAVNEVEEVQLLRAALAAVAGSDDPVALVGALRSALFGVSDTELYRFSRGGGRFSLWSSEHTAPIKGAERVADAMASLRRCAEWLGSLQPAAALERMAIDCGLFARASAGDAAVARAGCLARALELLRQVAHETWSVADLAAYLDELIFRDRSRERHDGLPARPHREAVRVMNLHQVKGLEAPVVFLADSSGLWRDDVDLCIDRRADPVTGFLAVRGPKPKPYLPGRLLAVPTEWDVVADREKRFLRAEHDRLLYVAATRAASRLVICRPPKRPRWSKLIESMEPPVVELPPRPAALATSSGAAAPDVRIFAAERAARCARLATPTYRVSQVKSMSVRGGVRAGKEPSGGDEATRLAGEHGTEWGRVMHLVLEAAAHRPIESLRDLAAAELEDSGMDRGLADRVLEIAGSVTASAIWRRSVASPRRLIEVPIQLLEPPAAGSPRTIVRGVIDLVFLEDSRWVIVDYKTDDTAKRSLDDLVAHYAPQVQTYAAAWSALAGEPVAEAGLYFVYGGHYRTVPLPNPPGAGGQLRLFGSTV